jgi:hypothetical protein
MAANGKGANGKTGTTGGNGQDGQDGNAPSLGVTGNPGVGLAGSYADIYGATSIGEGGGSGGGSSGGHGSSSLPPIAAEVEHALQDIVLAVDALRAGNLPLALTDVSAFESTLATVLQQISQVISSDMQTIESVFGGGFGSFSLNALTAADNVLLKDVALIISEIQEAMSSFGQLSTS